MRLLQKIRKDKPCTCLIEAIEYLGGQHPKACRNRIGSKDGPALPPQEAIGPIPKHQVDGIAMPWGWLPAPADPKYGIRATPKITKDVYHRWCDVSAYGDGSYVLRRWPEIRIEASIFHIGGSRLWIVAGMLENGDPDFDQISGSGRVATVADALQQAGRVVDGIYARIAQHIAEDFFVGSDTDAEFRQAAA